MLASVWQAVVKLKKSWHLAEIVVKLTKNVGMIGAVIDISVSLVCLVGKLIDKVAKRNVLAMLEEELLDLIRTIQKRQTLFQNIELKAASTDFPKIYDTLSSFSNQDEGGIIIFGVSEKDNYDAVGVYSTENAQKKAMEACEQMEPAVRAVFTSAEVDGKFLWKFRRQNIGEGRYFTKAQED